MKRSKRSNERPERSSGTCPREVVTVPEATVETDEPWKKSLDYTNVTERKWSEESQISLKEGEAAIVTKPDGSLILHIPGEMEEVSLGHSHAMLMAMILSGTPQLEEIYNKLLVAQAQSLDCANADESVRH